MTWTVRELGSVCKFLSGGTPKKDNPDYWDGDIPWVSAKDLKQSRIYSSQLCITPQGLAHGTKLVPENTILFVVRGMSLAKEFRISLSKVPVTFNQDLKALNPNDDIDPVFLFYALFSQRDHIKQLAGEAAHGTKRLPTEVLANIQVQIPDLVSQNKIGEIASKYDDLIDNNRRRIDLLEQACSLIYDDWFLRFRFPGHEHVALKNGIPESWSLVSLGEIAPLLYGKALKDSERRPGNVPVYGSSGVIGVHDKAMVKGPGIIVGRKGNVGSVFWCEDDFHPIDTVYFIPTEHSSLYLYHALQRVTFISTDVAVPGLNRDFAHSRKILVPDPKIQALFNEIISSNRKQIEQLAKYNHSLAEARDLLIPQLVSGSLTV